MDDILVYGTKEEIKEQPPLVVIEIFDQDNVVSEQDWGELRRDLFIVSFTSLNCLLYWKKITVKRLTRFYSISDSASLLLLIREVFCSVTNICHFYSISFLFSPLIPPHFVSLPPFPPTPSLFAFFPSHSLTLFPSLFLPSYSLTLFLSLPPLTLSYFASPLPTHTLPHFISLPPSPHSLFLHSPPLFSLQGKSEFIGRALARPHIKLREDPYLRPHLEWHDLFRGTDHAGELLATFELLQVCVCVLAMACGWFFPLIFCQLSHFSYKFRGLEL